jgi:hypothetical protein
MALKLHLGNKLCKARVASYNYFVQRPRQILDETVDRLKYNYLVPTGLSMKLYKKIQLHVCCLGNKELEKFAIRFLIVGKFSLKKHLDIDQELTKIAQVFCRYQYIKYWSLTCRPIRPIRAIQTAESVGRVLRCSSCLVCRGSVLYTSEYSIIRSIENRRLESHT